MSDTRRSYYTERVPTDGTAQAVRVRFDNGTVRGFLTPQAAIRYAAKRGLRIQGRA